MNRRNIVRVEPDKQLDTLAHAVIGAAIEVHKCLGPGYLESVYEEAMRIKLKTRGIPFTYQVPVSITYRACQVGEGRPQTRPAHQL
jgi:GxxExxY protein